MCADAHQSLVELGVQALVHLRACAAAGGGHRTPRQRAGQVDHRGRHREMVAVDCRGASVAWLEVREAGGNRRAHMLQRVPGHTFASGPRNTQRAPFRPVATAVRQQRWVGHVAQRRLRRDAGQCWEGARPPITAAAYSKPAASRPVSFKKCAISRVRLALNSLPKPFQFCQPRVGVSAAPLSQALAQRTVIAARSRGDTSRDADILAIFTREITQDVRPVRTSALAIEWSVSDRRRHGHDRARRSSSLTEAA